MKPSKHRNSSTPIHSNHTPAPPTPQSNPNPNPNPNPNLNPNHNHNHNGVLHIETPAPMKGQTADRQRQTNPTREEISACAYEIYLKEGSPTGRDKQHWLEAEAQLAVMGTATLDAEMTVNYRRASNELRGSLKMVSAL